MKPQFPIYLLCALLTFGMTAQAEDDNAKLHELEKAMASTPAGVEVTKKPKTRAIVFDPQPDTAQQPAPAAPRNCEMPPADAKLTGIDFTINFKLGSSEIAPDSEKILREIAKVLSLSDKCVIVEGHTDALGNNERNNILSRERAESVVNFISGKAGVDKGRLVPVGKGSSEPMKNLNPRDPQNRRVVFKVVG